MRVQVVMTDAAQRVHHASDLCRLTGHKVITGSVRVRKLRRNAFERHRAHRRRAGQRHSGDRAATADLLARLAHGLADDFLTTMYLAFTGRVVLAPAMNNNMWTHPATQENLAMLRKRGHIIVEPEEGLLACGTTGPGRLAEPERIAEVVARP